MNFKTFFKPKLVHIHKNLRFNSYENNFIFSNKT